MSNTILFILTSNDKLGDTGDKTGFHYEEMATPYYILQEAGYAIDFASPKGGKPPHDPSSLKERGENAESVEQFLDDAEANGKLANTRKTTEVDFQAYDAIYFPGGHGTMWDLPGDQAIAEKLGQAYDAGKIIAAVCHGPAGLVSAKKANGEPIVAGHAINCFTNAEENEINKSDAMPFLLESKLKELGGEFSCSDLFKAHVVEDGQLITGQNPASAKGLGEAIVATLKEKKSQAA